MGIQVRKLLIQREATYVVQVNGKVRANIVAVADAKEEDVAELAKQDEKVANYLEHAEITKQIFVEGKLINFVVKK